MYVRMYQHTFLTTYMSAGPPAHQPVCMYTITTITTIIIIPTTTAITITLITRNHHYRHHHHYHYYHYYPDLVTLFSLPRAI